MQDSLSVLDKMPNPVTIHQNDGTIVYVNEAYASMVGVGSRHEVIEHLKNGGDYLHLVHEEDRGLVNYYKIHRSDRDGDQPNKYCFRVNLPERDTQWMECQVSSFEWQEKPASLSTYYDVTAQRGIEGESVRLQALLEKAFNSVPCVIVLTSVENGRVLYVNDMAVDFYQYSREEILGKSVVQELNIWVDLEDRKRVTDKLAMGESVQKYRTLHRTKDGTEKPVTFYGTQIMAHPSPLMVAAIFDRSEEIQRMVEVAQAYAEATLAEEAARERSIFFGQVLDNLNQGMTVFSRKLELIAWNSTMNEIMEYPSDFLKEGMPFRDLAYFDAKRGAYGEGNPDELADGVLEELLRKERFTKDNQHEFILSDGRTLEIQNRVMMDGAVVSTFLDVTEQKQREENMRRQAMKDRLTGLANRRGFELGLKEAMADADDGGQGVVLAMLDLDNFKDVNDTHGHAAGDATLKFAADVLTRNIRDTDFVARLGGDEFAVVFQNTDNIERAKDRVTRMIECIASQKTIDGYSIDVGASGGVGLYPGNGKNIEQLMENVDAALYSAKRAGKGQVGQVGAKSSLAG